MAGLIPATIFYWMLARTAVNIPIVDDYYAILNSLNIYSQSSNLGAKLGHIVNYQHNEYKLSFESAIFAIEYELSGKINFETLSILGNAFVAGIFALLVKTFKFSNDTRKSQLLLLLPVGLLLFQLQYASTLNFSMAGLQNLPVLAFSLLSILLLTRNTAYSFASACVAMVLSTAASGSGFLLGPIGTLMLAEQRRWRHIGIWAIVLALIAAIYFSNYNFHPSQLSQPAAAIQPTEHLYVTYMLAFMGSSIARYQGYMPSVALGTGLLILWAFAAWRGYSKKNPTVFYFFLFLVLTAAGVSAIRSGLGLEQSLASRYRIYSNLLLILSYIFVAENYLQQMQRTLLKRALMGATIICCLAFYVLSNQAGYRFLQGRQQAVSLEMAAWQLSQSGAPAGAASPTEMNLDPAVSRQLAIGLYKPVTAVLTQSMKLGIYQPPVPVNH